MGWATPYIQQLKSGTTVSFGPRGHSMAPRIRSGQLCTVGLRMEVVEVRIGHPGNPERPHVSHSPVVQTKSQRHEVTFQGTHRLRPLYTART